MCNEKQKTDMSNKTLFYHGFTDDYPGQHFTMAGTFEKETNLLKLGVSVCSLRDQFEKKLGRIRAEGRMKAKFGTRGTAWFKLEQPVEAGKEVATFLGIVSEYSHDWTEAILDDFNLRQHDMFEHCHKCEHNRILKDGIPGCMAHDNELPCPAVEVKELEKA
jgi:hypothetical protein